MLPKRAQSTKVLPCQSFFEVGHCLKTAKSIEREYGLYDKKLTSHGYATFIYPSHSLRIGRTAKVYFLTSIITEMCISTFLPLLRKSEGFLFSYRLYVWVFFKKYLFVKPDCKMQFFTSLQISDDIITDQNCCLFPTASLLESWE